MGGKIMYERIFKRIIDFLVAFMLLPIYLLFYMIIGFLIKLEDGGPIIYTQRRLGRNGKIFNIKKFRTMKTNAIYYTFKSIVDSKGHSKANYEKNTKSTGYNAYSIGKAIVKDPNKDYSRNTGCKTCTYC